LGDQVKLEITQSMIEINSSVHLRHVALQQELTSVGRSLLLSAGAQDVLICGGGTHPFHRWQERRLSPTERFHEVGQQYGYLAKQFTVFGQHVHIGCSDGDAAITAVRRLSLYVPHFIALSGGSPFHRGVDTAFDSCRLNMLAAFPLSGRMPDVRTWSEFVAFFDRLQRLGVVQSIKDFYWDIRPKPEFGTVEVRVPDTPLAVGDAADLAAYVQTLVEWTSRFRGSDEWLDDHVYRHNRFQAARFGYAGSLIIGPLGERQSAYDHLLFTMDQVASIADELECSAAIGRLAAKVQARQNDAAWLRDQFQDDVPLTEVVRRASQRWASSVQQPT